MKAIVISKPGGPEELQLKDVAEPIAQRGEIRIRVHATALNRADLLQRQGKYPPPPGAPADIPGMEYAGEVDSVGEAVTEFKVGDRVFGLVGGGSYAQYVVTNARTAAPMPNNLSFEQAAALPECCLTAYDAMVSQCGLSAGETVLISAVGSGVGTAAVQIARAIGAKCIGTSRTQDKLVAAEKLGLNVGIRCTDANFAEEVLAKTGGKGVDVVLELAGGEYVAESLKCLSPQGRLIVVGLVAGARVELDLARLLTKRLKLKGTTLRARPLEEKIQVAQVLSRHIVPLIETGAVGPIIDRTFPLSAASEAHSYMESNTNFGKIVLTL